jgi:hypothetical protein
MGSLMGSSLPSLPDQRVNDNGFHPQSASDQPASVCDARDLWDKAARPSARTSSTTDQPHQQFRAHWDIFTKSIAHSQFTNTETLTAWHEYIDAVVNGEIRKNDFLVILVSE